MNTIDIAAITEIPNLIVKSTAGNHQAMRLSAPKINVNKVSLFLIILYTPRRLLQVFVPKFTEFQKIRARKICLILNFF